MYGLLKGDLCMVGGFAYGVLKGDLRIVVLVEIYV